ncbi:TPA: hypothetical protein ACGO92_000765 [Streptococcus suis]
MKHLTNADEFLNFLIDKHCDQQKEEDTTTVTLFNKTFANATDALIAAIENFDMADANEFEDEGDFIGLSSALNAYAKIKADNTFIFTWLAEIMLGKEIDELTDKIIYKTAWELADHSNFDSVRHPLEII